MLFGCLTKCVCLANLPTDPFPKSITAAFTCVHVLREAPEKNSLFDPTQPTSQPTVEKRIGRYVVMSHCLGTGSFASVHLAYDPINHRQVACKSIKAKRGHEVSQVMKEVQILMTLKHVRLVRLLAWLRNALSAVFCSHSPISTRFTTQKRRIGSCMTDTLMLMRA